MNGWFNPDSWMDVLDHILLILGVLVTATVPTWIAARSRRDLRDVKEQVTNGHKSPLRVDLDRVLERLDALAKFVEEIQRGVSGLRTELVDEEGRRRDSVRELRSDLERNRRDCAAGIDNIHSDLEHKLFELEMRMRRDK